MQTKEETQRRAGQTQGPRRSPRRHTPTFNAQSTSPFTNQLQPLTFALFLQLAVTQQLHMATMDITQTETTYIIVYVDDTFIFSNSQANIDTVITSIGKHYEVTLDREATSFLGQYLAHNTDETVTITQPKLLAKLFSHCTHRSR